MQGTTIFSVWCSPEFQPLEQYLECTETAMVPAVLTVEADDGQYFPTFRRLAASSSR